MCVCVYLAVCSLSEGAGCLQQLWLFTIRDPEDGEDHSGQTELGSAHRHSSGLPAHRKHEAPFLTNLFHRCLSGNDCPLVTCLISDTWWWKDTTAHLHFWDFMASVSKYFIAPTKSPTFKSRLTNIV